MGKLQELCKEKNISMSDLAARCGYNPNSFYNAASRGRISKGIAEKIRGIYPEISLDWLLGDSPYMNDAAAERARQESALEEIERFAACVDAIESICEKRGYKIRQNVENGEVISYSILCKKFGYWEEYVCPPENYCLITESFMDYVDFYMRRFLIRHAKRVGKIEIELEDWGNG